MSLTCAVSEIQRDVDQKSPTLTWPTCIWHPSVGDSIRISLRSSSSENYKRRLSNPPRFSVLVEVWLVMNRQIDDDSIYCANIASQGYKMYWQQKSTVHAVQTINASNGMPNNTYRSSLRHTSHIVVSLNVAMLKLCKLFCACGGFALVLLHSKSSRDGKDSFPVHTVYAH